MEPFFPGAYTPFTRRVTAEISVERLHLANLYQQGARFRKMPIMITIVVLDLHDGRDQAIYQLLEDHYGQTKLDQRLRAR